MTEVFAHAFYNIALLNPSDQFHAGAVAATQALTQRLVTTSWVLIEVADALSAPDPHTIVVSDFDPWFIDGQFVNARSQGS